MLVSRWQKIEIKFHQIKTREQIISHFFFFCCKFKTCPKHQRELFPQFNISFSSNKMCTKLRGTRKKKVREASDLNVIFTICIHTFCVFQWMDVIEYIQYTICTFWIEWECGGWQKVRRGEIMVYDWKKWTILTIWMEILSF